MLFSRKPPFSPGASIALFLLVYGGMGWCKGDLTSSSRLWPLPIQPSISSSFGEYRGGHLHAGIDLRTQGRDGVPCLAVDDGYVSRMRASPFGYGKALYITLRNGETAVYAHLSEFSPHLEAFFYNEQKRLGTYEIDISQPSGRMPVHRGETIGYSGSTGGVSPHLHFEIRDAGENPMNPLTHGWISPDSVLPRIDRLVWIPLDKRARINGSAFPTELEAARLEDGLFFCRDTVTVNGPVGLSVKIVDQLDSSSGLLCPYRFELFVDGERITRIEMERFSFPQSGEVDLVYEMERALARREHFINLFERPGESLWNRQFQNGGVIHPESNEPKGAHQRSHRLEVRASDIQGNTSVLTAPFYMTPAQESSERGISRSGAVRREPGRPMGFFIFDDLLSVQTQRLGKEALARLYLATGKPGRQVKTGTTQTSAAYFTASTADFDGSIVTLHFKSGTQQPTVYLVPARAAVTKLLVFPDIGATLRLFGRSLYGNCFIYLSEWHFPKWKRPMEKELALRSKIIFLGPLSLALRSSIEISLHLQETGNGSEGIYRLDEKKGKWDFISTVASRDSARFQTRQPGIFAAFSDRRPPRIHKPSVRKHLMYAKGWAFPQVVIRIDDNGSGLDVTETSVQIDGEKQIARWDEVAKKIFVLLRDKKMAGSRKLKVVAVDCVGNTSHLEANVSISGDYFEEPLEKSGELVE